MLPIIFLKFCLIIHACAGHLKVRTDVWKICCAQNNWVWELQYFRSLPPPPKCFCIFFSFLAELPFNENENQSLLFNKYFGGFQKYLKEEKAIWKQRIRKEREE